MSEASAKPYGVVAEFLRPADVVTVARELRHGGVRRMDVYSPTPIDEIDEIVAPRPRRSLALIMFFGGCIGAVLCYFLQYYAAVIGYRLDIGGRPYNSWPAFVPSAWEVCALFTVYAGFFAFFLYCRLPLLSHPIFSAPGFERASQDRFFVCVEADDPHYDVERLSRLFAQGNAVRVTELAR